MDYFWLIEIYFCSIIFRFLGHKLYIFMTFYGAKLGPSETTPDHVRPHKGLKSPAGSL